MAGWWHRFVEWRKKKAIEHYFEKQSPLAERHRDILLRAFREKNGIDFDATSWSHRDAMDHGIITLSLGEVDRVFGQFRQK